MLILGTWLAWFTAAVSLVGAENGGAPAGASLVEELAGARIHLQLSGGEIFKNAKVVSCRPGKLPGTIGSLTVVKAEGGSPLVLGAAAIKRLRKVDGTCDLAYDPAVKALLSPQSPLFGKGEPPPAAGPAAAPAKPGAVRDPGGPPEPAPNKEQDALQQLVRQKLGVQEWPTLTDEEQRRVLEDQRQFLEQVRQAFLPTPVSIDETDYFLVASDMSEELRLGFIPYLDKMYGLLCPLFAIPKGTNIWRGKALVLAFRTPDGFRQFLARFRPGDAQREKTQGLAYCKSDGTVMIPCYLGDTAPNWFGHVLVHETFHGFIHRYRSSEPVPSWLNEGAAEWVAANVLAGKTAREIVARQEKSINDLYNASWALGHEFFLAEQIKTEHYGLAYSLTDFLLRQDRKGYKRLIDGIKQGKCWDEALQEAYGWTPAKLLENFALRYASALPDLTFTKGPRSYTSSKLLRQLHLPPDWREAGRIPVFVSYDVRHDADLNALISRLAARTDAAFTVSGSSAAFADTPEWKDRSRRAIRQARRVFVLVGEHTDEARGVAAEIQMAQEAQLPCTFLWGRDGKNLRLPPGVDRRTPVYEWQWKSLNGLAKEK